MKEKVIEILSAQVPLPAEEIEKLIESPPDSKLGDYAFPCFSLARHMKKSPIDIANEIVSKIKNNLDFEQIEAKGPYVNFFVNRVQVANKVIKDILIQKEKYGSSGILRGKRIVIEFSSPNIAKPFGIGHLRSTIIGNSLANIAAFQGGKVTRINYLGDWGTQFGKLIVGYEKWGNEKKLKSDPINHLLDLYIRVSGDPDLEQASRDAFKKLELGDKKYLALWKKFRTLSLLSFNKIYKQLGVSFDVFSGESLYEKEKGKVVTLLNKSGLLKESQGALIVDLSHEGFGICLIQKNDGTTLYATRDIAAAIDRQKKYKFDEMWYEVGAEQKLHFNQLFCLLENLGYPWSSGCRHVEHGLYLDADGKKFATRKGKTVLMEGILSEAERLAVAEITKREKVGQSELKKRAHIIGLAAIIYGDLKNYRAQDIVFDIDRLVSFDGDTGPYILYSYARAKSILAKLGKKVSYQSPSYLAEQEKQLVMSLSSFPDIAATAEKNLTPHTIANYTYKVAQQFNDFYQNCPVVGSEEEKFRASLVQVTSTVLKNSLSLLGIPVLEKM